MGCVRVVDGPYVSSIGPTRGFWAVGIVDRGYARRIYGRVGSGGDKWEEGVGKTNHDFHRGSFRNAPVGPPISWVPPGISLPPRSLLAVRRVIRHLRHGLLVVLPCAALFVVFESPPLCRFVAIPVLLLLFSFFLLLISPVLPLFVSLLVVVVVSPVVHLVVCPLFVPSFVAPVRPVLSFVVLSFVRRPSFVVLVVVVCCPRRLQPAITTLGPEQLSQAAHILFEGGGGGAGILSAGSVSNWAHIPQERGGAPCGVNARGWAGIEEAGSMWWW